MLRPVILAGGSGTRLWPLSREHFPKQFLSLVGEGTMFQQSALRLVAAQARCGSVEAPLVVCNEDHRYLVVEQLADVGISPEALILEPVGKNTAPAFTLAALWRESQGGDDVLMAVPADHYVSDLREFSKVVEEGYALAQEGRLVTFGVPPARPETGYGYIRVAGEVAGSEPESSALEIGEFVEKPSEETAKSYLSTGEYLWNSGIFVMRSSVWLTQIEAHRPDIAAACRAAHAVGQVDGEFFRPGPEEFRSCPADSIDYAVAERVAGSKEVSAVVVPMDAGWSDVGTWSAVRDSIAVDGNGNVVRGDVLTYDVRDSTFIAENRLIAGVGLKGLVVVETPDAVLVAGMDRDQDVREVVAELRASDRDEQLDPRKVHRPWGTYEVIEGGEGFQVKHLTVKPGASLSLQRHQHRAEHWVVVRGRAAVIRGEETYELAENQSTYVPKGVKHRLSNPGQIPLEIVEVQTGDYLGEDDIERFKDDYRRA